MAYWMACHGLSWPAMVGVSHRMGTVCLLHTMIGHDRLCSMHNVLPVMVWVMVWVMVCVMTGHDRGHGVGVMRGDGVTRHGGARPLRTNVARHGPP